MKIFSNNRNFKKNILKNKINIKKIKEQIFSDENLTHYNGKKIAGEYKFNKIYKIALPKKKDVSLLLSKKIKLKDIRKIKTDYYYAYQELLNKHNNKKKLIKKNKRKRIAKFAASFVLFIAIVGMVVISQTKEVKLVVNGVEQKIRTNQFFTSIFAKKIAEKNNLEDYKYNCSTDNVLENNSVIEISSLKEVETKLKGETVVNKTYADTLEEFMEEQEKNLEQYDGKYTYYIEEYQDESEHDSIYLTEIDSLQLYLMSKKTVDKTITTDYETKYVDNDKLESGTLKVKQEGKKGKYVKTYETIYLDDKKYKTTTKVSEVIQKKQDKIIERGTKVVSASDSVWDRLAQCESGGRWHLNTGNGFYGGLQFSAATWTTAASKVGVTAEYAHLASKEDQIKAAVWLQQNSGWGQWPHCSSKLGLK